LFSCERALELPSTWNPESLDSKDDVTSLGDIGIVRVNRLDDIRVTDEGRRLILGCGCKGVLRHDGPEVNEVFLLSGINEA
jgi:hypothetical protein